MLYVVSQCVGGIAGAMVAHGMFELVIADFEAKDRDTWGECMGEAVATFGLLTTILGCIGVGNESEIPMAVGLYITAGYWYTSSTSFANPAVTIARSFTSTFAGIKPMSIPMYFIGQLIGFVVAVPFNAWMFDRVDPVSAVLVLAGRMRRGGSSESGPPFVATSTSKVPTKKAVGAGLL